MMKRQTAKRILNYVLAVVMVFSLLQVHDLNVKAEEGTEMIDAQELILPESEEETEEPISEPDSKDSRESEEPGSLTEDETSILKEEDSLTEDSEDTTEEVAAKGSVSAGSGDEEGTIRQSGIGEASGGIVLLDTHEPDGTEHELHQDATVTITFTDSSGAEIDPNGSYSRDASFILKIEFTFADEEQMESGSYMKLPDELNIMSDVKGSIYDQKGNYAGEYYIVTDSNGTYVFFEFDSDWEKTHEGETGINGYFQALVSIKEDASNNKGDVDLEFDDDFSFNIPLEDGTVSSNKTYQVNSDGTITFTIAIDVTGEDAKSLILTDTLGTNLSFVEGSFTLRGEDGRETSVSQVLITSQNGQQVATMTLENLAIGHYTLTYSANVIDTLDASGLSNYASYTWETINGHTPDEPGTTGGDITVKKPGLSKNGSAALSSDGNLIITWTIEVTPGQFGTVLGTTITDVLGDKQEYTGDLTVSVDYWPTYSLGDIHQFVNSSGTGFTYQIPEAGYVIDGTAYNADNLAGVTLRFQYQTIVSAEDLPGTGGSTVYTNVVTDDRDYEAEAEVNYQKGDYDLVKKSGELKDGVNNIADWTITIDPSEVAENGDELTNVTLTDQLEMDWHLTNNARYTGNVTVTDDAGVVYEQGVDYTVTWNKLQDDGYSYGTAEGPTDANEFILTFTGNLNPLKTVIYVTYEVEYDATGESFYAENKVTTNYEINGEPHTPEEDDASIPVVPSGEGLVKDGELNGNTATWTLLVNYDSTNIYNGYYYIGLTNGIYTVKDVLPEDMTYVNDSAALAIVGAYGAYGHKGEIDVQELLTVTKEDGTLTFTIDLSEESVGTITYWQAYLVITFKTEIDLNSLETGKAYTNDASFWQGDELIGEDSATVTVENANLTKSAAVASGAINQIEYRIGVNYTGADLDPYSDVLTLIDTLDASVTLLTETIAVTNMTDGSAVDYTASYAITNDGRGQLTLTIPDETPVMITYRAHINGEVGEELFVTNHVHLSSSDQDETEGDIWIEYQDSSAGIESGHGSLTIRKIDADDLTKVLPGAEFSLYLVGDSQAVLSSARLELVDTKTTDENGEITFSDLTEDVLYFFVETKAPDGYTLNTGRTYFILSSTKAGDAYVRLIAACEWMGIPVAEWNYQGGYTVLVSDTENPEPKMTKEIFEDDYLRKEDDSGARTEDMHADEDIYGDGWGLWDDADNSQEIDFRITLSDIRHAKGLTVHDYLESGLAFSGITSIVLADEGAETILASGSDYTLALTGDDACTDPQGSPMDGCTFEIAFADSLFEEISDGAVLVISYTARTETAVSDYEDYFDAILNHACMTFGEDHTSRSDVVTTETDLFGFGLFKFTDEAGEEEPLAGAKFILIRINAEGKTEYAAFTGDDDGYLLNRWVTAESEATELISGADGWIRLYGLDDDTYLLTEIAAPAGFTEPDSPVTVVIDEDGTVTANGDSVSQKETAVHEFTVENEPLTFEFDLEKTDDLGNLLEGAVFTLTKEEGTLLSFIVSGDGKTYTVCDADQAGAVTTIMAGFVTITGLSAGTYTLTEIEAPDGYQMADPVTIRAAEGLVQVLSRAQAIGTGVLSFFGVTERNGLVVLAADETGTVTVVNRKLTEISGRKIWEDSGNQDGRRPESVTIELLADGDVVDTQTVTAGDDESWSFSFAGLYQYDEAGREISYTIGEVAVNGYTTAIEGNDVINTYKPDTTDISVRKVWNDQYNAYNSRPESITVILYANGDPVDRVTLTDENTDGTDGNVWSFRFTDLPKYEAGAEIIYTVEEIVDSEDYAGELSGDAFEGFVFTNYFAAPTFTKEVSEDDYGRKDDDIVHDEHPDAGHFEENVEGDSWGSWDDADNNQEVLYHIRIADIKGAVNLTVHDYLESGLTFIPFDETEDVDIILYDYGENGTLMETVLTEEIDYTFRQGTCTDPECLMEGCTYEIAFADEDFVGVTDRAYLVISYKAVTDTHADDYENYEDDILNHAYMTFGVQTYRTSVITTETELFGFGIYKYAGDEEAGEDVPLAGAEFVLTREDAGGAALTAYFATEINDTDGKTYYVAEGFTGDGEAPDGFTTILVTGSDGFIRIDGLDDDTYTLTEVTAPVDYRPLSDPIILVIDEWGVVSFDGEAASDTKETIVNGDEAHIENKPETYGFDLDKADDLYKTIEAEFTLTDSDGNVLYFSVNETADGVIYTVCDESDAGAVNVITAGSVRIEGLLSGTYILSETGTPEGYEGSSDISFTVGPVNENSGSPASVLAGKFLSFFGVSTMAAEVIAENVEEEGLTVINRRLTNISVTKIWIDGNNAERTRPENITAELIAGVGEEKTTVDEAVLSADNSWSAFFYDLPLYDEEGRPILYEVQEKGVPEGYESVTERNEQDDSISFTITNTRSGETMVSGTKTWNDEGNQDGVRPDSVTVHLFANDTEIDSVTVTEEDSWSYRFLNLPQFDEDGFAITYTILEDADLHYTPSYDGYDIVNDHTPDQTSLSVRKVWDDADNQDGIRPASVTVSLLAFDEPVLDEEGTPLTLILDESNEWCGTFSGLDIYRDGEVIPYTAEEIDVPDGYEFTLVPVGENGYTYLAVNSHSPEETEIPVTKQWSDSGNRYDSRPESVTVLLFADGMPVTDADGNRICAVLDESSGWSAVFDGLEKYRDAGTEILYTVQEEAVPDYTGSTTGNAADGFVIRNKFIEPKMTKEILEDDYMRKDEDIFHHDQNGDFEENTAGDGWGTWDDADNGQEIVYQLVITDIKDAVNLVVHDYLEEGLDFERFNEAEHVDVVMMDGDGNVIRSLTEGTDFIWSDDECSDPACLLTQCTFEVAFDDGDFKEIPDDAYLVMTYLAKTNTHAADYEDYKDDLINAAYMTFGVSALYRSEIVRTETELFGIGIFKYAEQDGKQLPLAGAGFILTKEEETVMTAVFVKEEDENDGLITYVVEDWINGTADRKETAAILTSGKDGMIRIDGLDDDTYRLTEVKAPDGYRTLDEPVTVVIDEDGSVTVSGQDADGHETSLYDVSIRNLPVPEEKESEEETTTPEETIPETTPEETIPETSPEETLPETTPETPEETKPEVTEEEAGEEESTAAPAETEEESREDSSPVVLGITQVWYGFIALICGLGLCFNIIGAAVLRKTKKKLPR